MTSPIKPPGGVPPGSVLPEVGATGDINWEDGIHESQAPKKSFKAVLEKVTEVQGAAGVELLRGVDGVAEALKSGQIDAATAVERLIARAMESSAAQQLNDAGRAALEAHLRQTLENDPALAQFVDNLKK